MKKIKVVSDLTISKRNLERRELESKGWTYLGVREIKTTIKDIVDEYKTQFPNVETKQYGPEVEIYVRGDRLDQ